MNEALESLNKAIEFDPKLTEAYMLRGEVLFVKGEIQKSQANFDKAMELEPKLNQEIDKFIQDCKKTK